MLRSIARDDQGQGTTGLTKFSYDQEKNYSKMGTGGQSYDKTFNETSPGIGIYESKEI